MSEVGRQLVKNEKARKRCLADTVETYRTIIGGLARVTSEEGLARLDLVELRSLLDALEVRKNEMQSLLQERGELVAAAGSA